MIDPAIVIGQSIVGVLQSPWDHSDEYSHCHFYLQLSNGKFVQLIPSPDGDLQVLESDHDIIDSLHEIDTSPEFPAYFPPSNEAAFPVGKRITRAIVDRYGSLSELHLVLDDSFVLTSELWEGQSALCMRDPIDFVQDFPVQEFTFVDYWSNEPVDVISILRSESDNS